MVVVKWLVVTEGGACRLLASLPRLRSNEQAIKLRISVPQRKAPPITEILIEMPEWPQATYEVMVGDEG